MAYYNQNRIEMALPKARDLDKVGKPHDAIEVLQNVLGQKRFIKVWSQTLEDMVMLFVELAARLRWRAYDMRHVLAQFRTVTQVANMSSLVKVLNHLTALAEKGVGSGLADAREQDDDYEDDTPEAISQYAFTRVEETKDRANRQRHNPAVRFLWDAYRTVLDTLRGNLKLQGLYHDVVRTVFSLCLQYKRTGDFRRFVGWVREHVDSLPAPAAGNEAESAELQARLLSTRLAQLSTASALEMWHETYSCIEDIHATLTLSLRLSGGAASLAAHSPAASTLLQIYEKLAAFFWQSKNTLYHSFALIKLAKLAQEAPEAVPATAADAAPSMLTTTSTVRLSAIVLSALVTDPTAATGAAASADAGLTFVSGDQSSIAPLLGFQVRARSQNIYLLYLNFSIDLAETNLNL